MVLLFLVMGNGSAQIVLGQNDINPLNSTFYVPGSLDCSPGQTSTTSSTQLTDGSVYALGDSLTVGMKPFYESLFGSKLVGTEATVGDTIQAAANKISVLNTVNVAIVGLGTNNYLDSDANIKSGVQSVVSKLRAVNPSMKIYWINIYAPKKDIADNSPRVNKVFSDYKATDPNFFIVDWFTEATSNPYTYDGQQLHPVEYDKRARFVYNAVTGGVASSTNTTVATSGTYTANVWGKEKALPEAWIPILGKAAQRFDVDPSILAALMSIETAWDTPESFATNPRRNSASATGPFQFVDSSAVEFMPAPDKYSTITDPARYTSKVIKQLNNGTDKEPDGSFVVDGNKDGIVDRATPEDSALMAAAYLKLLGVSPSTPLGTAGDYKVPKGARGTELTVRIVGAYYNQGPGFSAPNAVTAGDVNARAVGGNDVAHYMDQMMEVTSAGRQAGVYTGSYASGGTVTCSGGALRAGLGGYDLPGGANPMVYYSQLNDGTDSAVTGYFGTKKYGTDSIFKCGCGPTTMASIVSTLTANKVDPEAMAKWASEHNPSYQNASCGSDWFWTQSDTQQQFDILTTALNGADQIASALQAGKLVIISVANFPLPSSSDKGHISMIRKVEGDNFFLADSFAEGWADAKDISRRPYTSAELASIVNSAWSIEATSTGAAQ